MELTCLIVDDNLAFLRAASARLAPHGVSVVGLASSGDEAVLLAEKLRPALALVDVQLDGESGFDVARRLAATERPPRVILVSVRAEDDLVDMLGDAPVAGLWITGPSQWLTVERVAKLAPLMTRAARMASEDLAPLMRRPT